MDSKKNGSAKSKMTDHFVDDGNGGFYCSAIRAFLASVETPVFLGQRMLQADQGEASQAIPSRSVAGSLQTTFRAPSFLRV